MIILSIFFLITSILYSSVGFGGGSTYLALMLIWEIPFYIIPILALCCNIIVVSGNSINYVRSGNLNLNLLIPYLVGSIPFAFFGASISISEELFEIILFIILFIAGKGDAPCTNLLVFSLQRDSVFSLMGMLKAAAERPTDAPTGCDRAVNQASQRPNK